MSSASTLIRNVRVFDGETLHPQGWFHYSNVAVDFGNGPAPDFDSEIDGAGGYVTPLLFDTHIHGGGGFSAEKGAADMRGTLNHHRMSGTGVSFLSLMTDSIDNLCQQLNEASDVDSKWFRGIHLEGPFLSRKFKGCHPKGLLSQPSDENIARILNAGSNNLRSITLAPEFFSDEQLQKIRDSGVTVAIGHTDCDYEIARAALRHPRSVLTHAFNAMRGIHHRAPGPILAAIDANAYTELIADGLHVNSSVARLLNPERVILVTDAMSAAGQPDGMYSLGATSVTVSGGIARDSSGSLAGSTLHLNVAVKNYAQWIESPEFAFRAATSNPYKAYEQEPIGLDHGFIVWNADLDTETVELLNA